MAHWLFDHALRNDMLPCYTDARCLLTVYVYHHDTAWEVYKAGVSFSLCMAIEYIKIWHF